MLLMITLLWVTSSSSAICQWRPVLRSPSVIGSVYSGILNGKTVFVTGNSPGFDNSDSTIYTAIWTSLDLGETWNEVILPISGDFQDAVSDGKNLYAVFFASFASSSIFVSSNSGATWEALPDTPEGGGMGYYTIGYNSFQSTLYRAPLSLEAIEASSDQGFNWEVIRRSGQLIESFIFADGRYALAAGMGYNLTSSDGGLTWQKHLNNNGRTNFRQPAYDEITGDFFGISATGEFYRSTNHGESWSLASYLNTKTTACLVLDDNAFYVQTAYQGGTVLRSRDRGRAWEDLCGPGGSIWGDFAVAEGRIVAAEPLPNPITGYDGIVWLNTSGKGAGPRLMLSERSGGRELTAGSGDEITADVKFPDDFPSDYHTDSLRLRVAYAREMFKLKSLSVGGDWRLDGRTDSAGLVALDLKRIGRTGGPILSLDFQTYLSADTTGSISLLDVNFNDDSTFHDCLLSSLRTTDSVKVHQSSGCGDETLREFMERRSVFTVLNALDLARGTVRFRFFEDVLLDWQVVDLLGNVKFSGSDYQSKGEATIAFKALTLPSGIYHFVATAGGVTRTIKFVRQ